MTHEHIIKIVRGFNCVDFECEHDCDGDHGVHGLSMIFYVKGSRGAVHFGLT